MIISEFARERGVNAQAVYRYITRHPEVRALCRQSDDGDRLELTPEAEEMLSARYPMPKDTIEIVSGVPQSKYDALQEEHAELQKKYAAVLERLAQIQEARLEDQRKIAAGEAAQLLLEDREAKLQELEQRTATAEETAAAAGIKAEEAEREVSRLRSRGLWARIRNA